MQLLTQELRKALPPLYSGEEQGTGALALVKFFTPDAGWTWYASEFDGEDLFFGLCVGDVPELGYFSLSELERVRGKFGLPVERDISFEPTPLEVLLQTHRLAAV